MAETIITYIYGLRDPISGEIRYIGKTNNLKKRLATHLHLAKSDVNRHKKHWLKKLKESGVKPEMVILEKVDSCEWEEAEKRWIAHGIENKWPITNLTEGGSGDFGCGVCVNVYEALQGYLTESQWEKILSVKVDVLVEIAKKVAIESMPIFEIHHTKRDDDLLYHFIKKRLNEELKIIGVLDG